MMVDIVAIIVTQTVLVVQSGGPFHYFRAATQPHASAPSLAAIAAAPARSGSEPQPGGARQSAAWTCCVGWVRLKPQGFPWGHSVNQSWKGLRQSCLAHLLRTAKGLAESVEAGIARCGGRLYAEMQRLCHMGTERPTVGQWRAW